MFDRCRNVTEQHETSPYDLIEDALCCMILPLTFVVRQALAVWAELRQLVALRLRANLMFGQIEFDNERGGWGAMV